MATKNNPGEFDCYSKAERDEPMFVLLGRDPCAALVVRVWIALRRFMGQPGQRAQLIEAEACARSMEQWAMQKSKGSAMLQAGAALCVRSTDACHLLMGFWSGYRATLKPLEVEEPIDVYVLINVANRRTIASGEEDRA